MRHYFGAGALTCWLLAGCNLILGLEDDEPEAGPASGGAATGGWQQMGGAPGSSAAGSPEAGAAPDFDGGTGSDDSNAGSAGSASEPMQGPAGGESGATGDAAPTGSSTGEQAGTGGAPEQGGAAGGDGGAAGAVVVEATRPFTEPVHLTERAFRVFNPWPQSYLDGCFRVPDKQSLSASELEQRVELAARIPLLYANNWGRVIYPTLIWRGECGAYPGYATIMFTLNADGAMGSELGFAGVWRAREVELNVNATDQEILYWMGRALGFGHEFGLSHAPGACRSCEQDEGCTADGRSTCLSSGFCGRLADHESIMAAPDCGGIEPTRRLSVWDIIGAKRAYPSKPAGSIVSPSGLCLGDAAQTASDAHSLRMAPCGLRSDLWRWSSTAESSVIKQLASEPELCLAVDTASAVDTPVDLTACDGSAAEQVFEVAPAEIRSIGELCVTANSAAAGAPLLFDNCRANVAELQAWNLRGGRIQLAGTNWCATVREGVFDNGAPIELRTCGESPAWQAFSLRAGGIHTSGLCWSVLGGQPEPASGIALWNGCQPDIENEVFHLTGAVRAAEVNRCLARTHEYNWERVTSRPCDNSDAQLWDFYW